ncbi:hypothetical protein HOL52_02860, partial [bacterium]|nr:hypothetical protein [bacterium]
KLPITVITEGKIGITPVREIINVMLGLKQDEKIKSNSKYQQEKKANKKRVESARAKLKKLVLTGDLGEEAQTEYVKYLEENPEVEEIEIELSGSAKEIWQQVKGQTITYSNKEYRVNTIQDFLELTFTKIVKGKIGSTRVREIINALLGLEEGEKIKFIYGGTKREANKLNVENARISLKNKVIAGELGEEAKKEYKDYLTEEIDLSGSLEQIWKRIQGQTITYSNSEYRVNTIQDFLELTFTKIMKGKIGNTTVREIINAILGLEEDEKIKFIYHAKKEANKLNVENARILLKDKALAGDLGQEAQKEMQTIIETENIQTQIKEVIEEI